MFSTGIIEKLGYYIYCLVDPRNDNIFYVGKGVGNRVFEHVEGAISGKAKDSAKVALINEIHSARLKPKYYILRHGIEAEESAYEYEALAIDLLSLVRGQQQPLTNIQDGVNSSERGLMSLSELKKEYDPEELKTDLPILLININREYENIKRGLKTGTIKDSELVTQLYERTRKSWVVGKRREKVKYAVAVYRGWTLAAYEVEQWFPVGKRWGFSGRILTKDNAVYQTLVDKLTYSSDKDYKAPQNPINYKNC